MEHFLRCVVSAPKTAPFLRAALGRLSTGEVQLLLVYLKRWLFEYRHRLHSGPKFSRPGPHKSKQPSLEQVSE